METGPLHNPKLGSDSQDSDDLHQPGASAFETSVIKFSTSGLKPGKNVPLTTKGVENAKKRLRAFSIQKKSSLSPVSVPKPVSSGGATVFIGKLTGVKIQPKNEPDPAAEQKKLPKPPKPGAKQMQESYMRTQKKTLAEIEDMKRKMELVELGIPLGLICPAPNSDKAMPTKAMPPIKSFIDPAKVDELIREAKKARAEGKEFKFDYQKLLPDYDNPFQRKKNNDDEVPETPKPDDYDHRKSRTTERVEIEKRRTDKYDSRRFSTLKKSDKDRHKDKTKDKEEKYKQSEKSKDRDARARNREVKTKERDKISKDRDLKSKIRDSKSKEGDLKKEDVKKDTQDEKATDVNLNDFVVCDSWSDNEDKSKDSTPRPEESKIATEKTLVETKIDPMEQLRESLGKKNKESPKPIRKLKPVIDSIKFEIEDEEDDVLDIFDANSSTDKFSQLRPKKDKSYDISPVDMKLFEYDPKDETMDGMADDMFLESVINEIKQEEMDETSQDKGLVEYDESPSKDDDEIRDSVTPDMDDRVRVLHSSRSDYSDGYKSVDSGCKSIESGYKSTDSLKLSDSIKAESEVEQVVVERKLAKYTVDSLETWSFVLKICQPLLFRHDKNKCYKETRMTPKVRFTENPKLCMCVKDRRLVYDELEMCKTNLVDSLCSPKQVQEAAYPTARGWYLPMDQCLAEKSTVQLSSEWEAEDSQPGQLPATPERSGGEISLDKEYERFMEAVWPEVTEPKSETPRSTPVRREASKKKADEDPETLKRKTRKMKLSSEGWSQESDLEEANKSTSKRLKADKQKRKRKHSTSTSITDSSESDAKKRKKMMKKKDNKKSKSKEVKKRRVSKKNIKKIKDKQKRKKKIMKLNDDSDVQDLEKEKKKKDKKIRKKKLLKQKKKNQKKKKAKAKSSSSSSSESSSDSEPEKKSKKKKKSSEKKKRKKSTSESTQEELFDVNILNNIKTERVTDDEKTKQLDFSPRRHREIIDVKELQNDFVGNSIQIKKEVELEEHVEVEQMHVEEEQMHVEEEQMHVEEEQMRVEEPNVELGVVQKQEEESQESQIEHVMEEKELQPDSKEQDESQSTPQLPPDENNSQCSSQESVFSQKDQPAYEKDESHLRPSSQNSNYSFHDVMASGMYPKSIEHGIEEHDMQRHAHDMQRHAEHDIEMDTETYEQGNYEMYEQMAMAYQSDVASQQTSPPQSSVEQRIETVVRSRTCGEIKCDWRAGEAAAAAPARATQRPSRWGLKPGEVNIVLTGGTDQYPIRNVEPVYKIQSIANRTDNSTTGYDEAYMDMYGASDKLQYGDCFSTTAEAASDSRRATVTKHASSLDDRISLALKTTVLGEVAKETEVTDDTDGPDKGILVTKSLSVAEARSGKRVSFADGYRPGQDSDVEEPPVKKKKKSRRMGCAWPCPATHPDHVPLWDALPPPPPPPGSPPPPPAGPAPPTHLLRRAAPPGMLPPPPHGPHHKFDPNAMPAFLPPEPPPGIISFQNL